MSENDDISARLTALETVVSQLITHLAVRSDDPSGWVETRKVLALSAVNGREASTGHACAMRSRSSSTRRKWWSGDYSYAGRRGTVPSLRALVRQRRVQRRKPDGNAAMPRLSLLLALTIAATPALAQNPQPTSPTNPTVPIAPPNAPVAAARSGLLRGPAA